MLEMYGEEVCFFMDKKRRKIFYFGLDDDDNWDLFLDDDEEEWMANARRPRYTRERVNWYQFSESLRQEGAFEEYYRMSYQAFMRLIAMLQPFLHVDLRMSTVSSRGEEAISSYIVMHCTLRYLAGGSFHDIRTCGK